MTHLRWHHLGKLAVNTPTTGFLESAFLMSSLVNPYTHWSLKITHSNAHFCLNFRLSFLFFACSLLFERSVCILRPPYYLWLKKTIQPSFTFLSKVTGATNTYPRAFGLEA